MPRLHIIHDETGMVQVFSSPIKGVRSAVMDIEDSLNLAEIDYVARELIRLLLAQLSPEARHE